MQPLQPIPDRVPQCADAGFTPSTVVVDAVSDVVTLEPGTVHAAPGLSGTPDAGCISGLAQLGERMLILLDIDALLGDAVQVQDGAGLVHTR